MNYPFIFLFTCVYNDRKRIKKLFESVENQTSNNFIYYLYDDCSDDLYDDLFNNLQIKLSKKGIKSYYERGKKNLGINKATEHCLQVLRDRFKECTHFAWINSDDWLSELYIKTLSKTIIKHPNYSIYMPNIITVNELTQKTHKYSRKIINDSFTYLVDYYYKKLVISHFVVNKKNFLLINPNCLIYDNKYFKRLFNDQCILFLTSMFQQNTYFIHKPLSFFLKRDDALSSSKENVSCLALIKPQEDYLSMINDKYVDIYRKTLKVVFTHTACSYLVTNKKYNIANNLYKTNKILWNQLGLPKQYLFPLKTSLLLFRCPRLYRFLHIIKRKL